MIVADSSVWIDYFSGRYTREANLLDSLLTQQPILLGDLIVTEVLQGFKQDRHFIAAKEKLEILPFVEMVGKGIAFKSAENFRALRKQGITIRKTIDVLIATFCIENGHYLLHSDHDFDAIQQTLPLLTVITIA